MLEKEINFLQNLIKKNDIESILNTLKKVVVDYSPNTSIVDHTFNERPKN